MTATTATTFPTLHGTSIEQVQTAGRYGRAGALAGLAASGAVVAGAAVARQIGVDLQIDDKPIPLLGFAQVTFFFALVGIVLAAVLVRRAHRPRHTFVVTTVALTVLSLVPPVLVAADTATKVALEVLHVVAAAIVVPVIAARLEN
ncbi:MAG: DUF6069 family protein [Ilumatobacteraceae bacterium]